MILLAVIGVSAVIKHIPAITALTLSLCPRLTPAPETFLGTNRVNRLPVVSNIKLVGIYSGTLGDELNYFANLIHNVDSIETYYFQHRESNRDLESPERPVRPLRIKPFSAINLALAYSVTILVSLFIAAGVLGDGVALVALTIMGLSSSAASVAAWWAPSLVQRKASCTVSDADQLIIRRGAAMVLVKCNEQVCRELYVGRDQCAFTFGDCWHRILLAVSTLLVMISVVLFNNCSWRMQLAIGAGYFVLNIQYWLLALLVKPKDMWDLNRYTIEKRPPGPYHANPTMDKNYTQTLWLAIWHTQTTGWVRWANAMPATEKWAMWLDLARQNLQNASWDAVAAKNTLYNRTLSGLEKFEVRLRQSARPGS